jgi:hypothetical protein
MTSTCDETGAVRRGLLRYVPSRHAVRLSFVSEESHGQALDLDASIWNRSGSVHLDPPLRGGPGASRRN